MKRTLTLLSLLPIQLLAQSLSPAPDRIYPNERTNTPGFVQFRSAAPAFSEFNEWSRSFYRMRPEDGLQFMQANKDQLGYSHHRYQQVYQQIPVEWAIVIVHEKDGMIRSVNGDLYADITPLNRQVISAEHAIQAAIKFTGATIYKWELTEEEAILKEALGKPEFSYQPTAQLVLLPDGEGEATSFRYAYNVDIYAHEPMGRWDVYIDAETGEQLRTLSKIHTGEVTGTAHTKYSGTRSIQTDSIAPDTYRLREYSRGGGIETYNLNRTNNYSGAQDFVDSNNVWDNFNSYKDEVATDVHWGTEVTYDYYQTMMSRNSYDDKNSKILSYVHLGNNVFNAYWNGSYMSYGDGSGAPLTSLDVCGHELTHGVTQTSAALIYARESGGLNESFSDVMGEAVEFWAKPAEASWRIGEDFSALRNMANPGQFGDPDTYKGDNWKYAEDDCVPNSGTNDNCGVHSNSGVQNFWFYLLSDGGTGVNDNDSAYSVTGIGIQKAAQIAYRNLTVYLTPTSKYNDARFYAVQAAIDLFGESSNEMIQTTNAWFAVGLGQRYAAMPTSNFTIKKNFCQPNSTFEFINNSGNATSFEWNFGDGQTSTDFSPKHTYANSGTYTVKLIAFNSSGSDTLIREDYISLYNDFPKALTCSTQASSPIGTIGIYNLTFNTINNSSSFPTYEGSYVDFTCVRTTVEPGVTYPISIQTNNTTKVYTRTWIDYNNDGMFSMPDELVFATDSTVALHTGTVTVPLNATLNTPLRMRVISSRPTGNDPSNPCVMKYGQMEDYAVYVSPANGVSQQANDQVLRIYPNPAAGMLNIRYTGNESASLQIFDLVGRLVLSKELNARDSFGLDMSAYPKGMYYVRIQGSQQQVTKIILQ